MVGFDFDQGALENAFARARARNLDFLPLYFDAANSSPDQGWAASERVGFQSRAKADAILALAFIHHLAIGRNVPLDRVMQWLIRPAPQGVNGFVEKSDPTVQRMLQPRDDIFHEYSFENFQNHFSRHAGIVKTTTVSRSGRRLIWFTRS